MFPQPAPSASPGVRLGILGGGQLGRMLALAAARLGIPCHVYADRPDSPAFEVVCHATCADYADEAALARFAQSVDVVTYEFENIPDSAVALLERLRPVLPGARALATTQDRLSEKRFVRGLGLATAEFAEVSSRADLEAAVGAIGRPAILKTRRLGYDGKGQAAIRAGTDLDAAWRAVGAAPSILEAFVPFEREASVVAARGADGTVRPFDLTENVHRDHILHTSTVPADVPAAVGEEAMAIAASIGAGLDFVGVFAVELFVLPRAAGSRLVVNEIAPRRAQFRPLDARRLHRVAVRAARARGVRPAAGEPAPARPGGDDQSDRRRGRELARAARRARRRAAPLRQGGGPARPENGSRHSAGPTFLMWPAGKTASGFAQL